MKFLSIIIILLVSYFSYGQVNDSILQPPVVKMPTTPGVNGHVQTINLAWADTIIPLIHKVFLVQLRPLCDDGKKRKTIYQGQNKSKKGCYTESVILEESRHSQETFYLDKLIKVKSFDEKRMYKWKEIDSTDYTSVIEYTLGKRKSHIVSMCYEPRHAIVFRDSKDNIIGLYEICFECGNSKIAFNYVESISIYSEDFHTLKKLFTKYGFFDEKKTQKNA